MATPAKPNIQIHPWAFPNSLQFNWTPSPNVSSYTLICSSIEFSQSYNSSTFTALVSDLNNNQDYTFQLATSNSTAISKYIPFLTVEPGYPSQGATNIVASTVNSTTALVSWSYSTNVNECRARYFAVSAVPSTVSLSTYVYIAYPDQRSFQILNLEPTMSYTFLVQAITDAAWAYPFSYSYSPLLEMNSP